MPKHVTGGRGQRGGEQKDPRHEKRKEAERRLQVGRGIKEEPKMREQHLLKHTLFKIPK